MKKINWSICMLATLAWTILLIPSFLAAFGEDEGTLPKDSFWTIFAQLFYVMRFPTHTLFWDFIINSSATSYFAGLFINCLFYGLLTERFYSFIKNKNNTD
jgi:hypothetical protein